MKKVFALFLVLALLIPMGIPANAAEADIRPFYMVTWDEEGEGQGYTNVYPMAIFWSTFSRFTEDEAHVFFRWKGGSTYETIAENLKELFDTFPEGARYINYNSLSTALMGFKEDIFLDKGVPLMVKWLDGFLAEYKRIGGKLDGLTIDLEFTDIWAYYVTSKAAKDPMLYDRIVKHPSYQNKIRPELEKRGFKFYENVTELTPEIYSLTNNSACQSIWDSVMRNYVADVITEACEPLWKYYPDALVSDYTTKDSKPWNMDQEIGGSGGNWRTAGNMSNENFYMGRPLTTFYAANTFSTVPGYNSAIYEKTAFNRFKYDNNVGRTTRMSSDTGNISYWIGGYYYGAKGEGSMCETPYYAENLIHLGMLDPKIYLGYILQQDAKQDSYTDLVLALDIVDDILVELTRVVGGADREPILTPPSMNDHYVLSGMHVGGKNIWRLTPDTGLVSVEEFKIAGDDPTFSVNGQTITFPGGKIIETGDIREVGTCGYWIETAENVNPVVTRSEEYYRTHAGYQENYDAFELGTTYNYDNAQPAACWEIRINKNIPSSSTIVADPADATKKVLELKGNVSLTNVKMPKNVTAGDTYAENQAWEVSVTLPADLPADAELVLLNAGNEKKVAKDGGFKIAGGKVYYDKDGEYVEMAGVTLTPGAKYTFIRDMNFNDPENFTCDYYIYGANGELVSKAKKVPIEELVLPIYSICMYCTKMTGGAVLVDDYKLYPSRVTTDFSLYNADTGMKVTETDKAQEGNVAYRLSWLNASNTEKSYTVMAAYYDGETKVSEEVIKDLKMPANFDGIVTGVVENKNEGKNLLIYLKDNNPAEPEDEDSVIEPTDEPKSNGLDTQMIIIIAAAAAVVVIAVVVIIIVASAKKKKKLAAAEDNTETPKEN